MSSSTIRSFSVAMHPSRSSDRVPVTIIRRASKSPSVRFGTGTVTNNGALPLRDHSRAKPLEAGHQDSTRAQVWLPQSQTCTNFVPGGNRHRLQDHSGHAAVGRPFNPAQSLRALAHGKVHGGSGKDDRSHGSERRNRSTAYPLGVGDRPWVILPVPCRQISAKFFGMVVARDGVELPKVLITR